jgi:hypothetical protein
MSLITGYTSLTAPAAGDLLPIVDISDTTMSSAGTTKKITTSVLLASLTLDTTATDIQQNGVQSAGGTGKVPDAGHVHPASGIPRPADTGVIAWTADPFVCSTNAQALVAGKLMLAAFWVRKTATISTIGINVPTAGATLTASENWAGVYNSSGTLMGQTADQSTAWAGTSTQSMAITSPFSAPGGMYWVALLFNGTTPPTLRGSAGAVGFVQLGQAAAASRVGVYGSAQTTLPSTITPASIVQASASMYCAVIY